MNQHATKALYGFALASMAAMSSSASAAVVTFDGVKNAVYGQANETPDAVGCPTAVAGNGCYSQNGVLVGIVKDPLDSGAHVHRFLDGSDRELQYHEDSTGIYVRMEDNSAFSLQSFDFTIAGAATPKSFVIYGYANALNPGLLTDNADTDADWGTVTPVATYRFGNNGSATNVSDTLQVFANAGAFGNIKAFWIHFDGYPHSPTESYLDVDPPINFDLRIDNVTLGAPAAVPLPPSAWLFGSAIAGLAFRRRNSNR